MSIQQDPIAPWEVWDNLKENIASGDIAWIVILSLVSWLLYKYTQLIVIRESWGVKTVIRWIFIFLLFLTLSIIFQGRISQGGVIAWMLYIIAFGFGIVVVYYLANRQGNFQKILNAAIIGITVFSSIICLVYGNISSSFGILFGILMGFGTSMLVTSISKYFKNPRQDEDSPFESSGGSKL